MLNHGVRILSTIGNSDDHCICGLDYDNIHYMDAYAELQILQRLFDLGTFYIFRTSPNHYMVVCFDTISTNTMDRILEKVSIDCYQKRAFSIYGRLGFRITPKHKHIPEPFGRIMRKSSIREPSESHITFFKGLYPNFIIAPRHMNYTFEGLTFEEFRRRE